MRFEDLTEEDLREYERLRELSFKGHDVWVKENLAVKLRQLLSKYD